MSAREEKQCNGRDENEWRKQAFNKALDEHYR
jgi:hypothetical protein